MQKSKPEKVLPPERYTNEDAARYLGVTPRTLDVWRCKKRYAIPYIKVGNLVQYTKEDLDHFLKSRTVNLEDA